jgi:hypothetical protein
VREGDRYDHPIGVPAVHVPSSGDEIRAEVLASGQAPFARAAALEDPTHTDTPPQPLAPHTGSHRIDLADHLVSRDPRQLGRRCATFNLVELGMTDAAGAHPQAQLTDTRLRVGPLGRLQRRTALRDRADPTENHRAHGWRVTV